MTASGELPLDAGGLRIPGTSLHGTVPQKGLTGLPRLRKIIGALVVPQDASLSVPGWQVLTNSASSGIMGDQLQQQQGYERWWQLLQHLGAAVSGKSTAVAAVAVAIGYVGSSSMVGRGQSDSAALRIPGWSLGVPFSRPNNSGSSSGDTSDQL